MPTVFTYPSPTELQDIEKELVPDLTEDDPIFKYFPIVNKDASQVSWEQEDNYTGLMNPRGVNGQATTVKMPGGKRYSMDPGRYSDAIPIQEGDLENRRQLGSLDGLISISDLVISAQNRLLNRRIMRMRWILWTLLTAGIFAVIGPNGTVVHTDQYPLQTATAAVAWATSATATPIKDLRLVRLKARGKSVKFGKQAVAFANSQTIIDLLQNANAADLFGKRIENGNTTNTLEAFNAILAANDCPQIVEFDEGYLDESGNFQLFIPNNKVVIVGQRTTNAPLGEFQVTRNASNDNVAPGPYTYVSDSINWKPVPRVITVDDGFNGGPAIFFPSAVVIMTV